MSDEDKTFDRKIHDAYEGVRLSEDAQDRMLASLLSAQRERREAILANDGDAAIEAGPSRTATIPHGGAAAKPTVRDTKADSADKSNARRSQAAPDARRRVPWKVVLPLAAALLVGIVVVRLQAPSAAEMSTLAPQDLGDISAEYDAQQRETDAVDVADDVREEAYVSEGTNAKGAAEAEASAEADHDTAAGAEIAEERQVLDYETTPEKLETTDDAATTSETPVATADSHPLITLADGTQLSTAIDGKPAVEVDEEKVGAHVGSGTATARDQGSALPCEVYELVDVSSAYAVRYDGEDGWWLAASIE